VVYDDDNFYMASVIVEALCKLGHGAIYATPQPMVATWTDYTLDQGRIIQRFIDLGVAIKPNTQLTGRDRWVDLLSGKAISFPNTELLLVGARKSNDNLYQTLQSMAGEVHLAGDSLAPGTIQAAVLSGHTVARTILSPPDRARPFLREQSIGAAGSTI